MNGDPYTCICGHSGGIPPGRGWYECPVCRYVGQTKGGRSVWSLRKVIRASFPPKPIVRSKAFVTIRPATNPPRVETVRERWTEYYRAHRIIQRKLRERGS